MTHLIATAICIEHRNVQSEVANCQSPISRIVISLPVHSLHRCHSLPSTYTYKSEALVLTRTRSAETHNRHGQDASGAEQLASRAQGLCVRLRPGATGCLLPPPGQQRTRSPWKALPRPRLVLAKRIPSIIKFIEVTEDQTYHSRIKELVYDVSDYQTYGKDEPSWYRWIQSWETAPSHVKNSNTPLPSLPAVQAVNRIRQLCASPNVLQTANTAERTVLQNTLFSTVLPTNVYQMRQVCAATTWCGGRPARNLLAHITDQCEESFTVDNSRAQAIEDYRIPRSQEPTVHTDADYARRMHAFGAHVGLLDQQLALEQMGVIESLIVAACKTLKKLDRLTFTDHRGLARNGESYHVLCQRLFRNNVVQLAPASPVEKLQLLEQLLTAWACGGNLQRLETGTHMFAVDRMHITGDGFDLGRPFWIDGSFNLSTWSNLVNKFGDRLRLRHLRCHIHLDESDEYAGQMVPPALGLRNLPRSVSETLTHLTLSTQTTDMAEELMDIVHIPNYFTSIVSPVQLPHLRHLSLTSWFLDLLAFKDFLLAHSPTLQHLHLIRCFFAADPFDEQQLVGFPAWVGETLNLKGVEVFGLQRRKKTPSSTPHGLPRVELQPLSVVYQGGWEDRRVWDYAFEHACLAGRKNEAVAQARPALELRPGEELGDKLYYW